MWFNPVFRDFIRLHLLPLFCSVCVCVLCVGFYLFSVAAGNILLSSVISGKLLRRFNFSIYYGLLEKQFSFCFQLHVLMTILHNNGINLKLIFKVIPDRNINIDVSIFTWYGHTRRNSEMYCLSRV